MHDHDQRFKTLIREFFAEFLLLFFAAWAERLDCSRVEWLDKEAFSDPPDGERAILDLVGKLGTREEVVAQRPGEKDGWLALVHIEIESPDKAAPLRPRMYHALRERYGLPVLPIAIYLRVGLDGIGVDVFEEFFWEFRTIRFEYLYVGLRALDPLEYLEKDNCLAWALASLMKVPKDQAAWLGAEALRRISEAPLSPQKKFLLGECVQAYLPLDEEQQREYEKLIGTEKFAGVKAMNQTVYEKGIEKGRAEQRILERQAMLREQLEEQFGPLSAKIETRLTELSLDELKQLGKAILHARSLHDLGLE